MGIQRKDLKEGINNNADLTEYTSDKTECLA